MSAPVAAAVCGLLTVAAIATGWRAFRPSRLTLRAMRDRVQLAPVATSASPASGVGWLDRLGHELASGSFGRSIERSLRPSLLLTGYTVQHVTAQMVTAFMTVAAAGFGLVVLGTSVGAVGFSPIWFALVLLLAGLAAFRVIADVRRRAARRRTDLRRVVNDFVQLLAVALTTNRSVEDSVTFAAEAGEGESFELLRQTIATARPMGISIWDALNAMADRYDLTELRGLTSSLQRQAGVGVSVAATIRAEAKSLREKQLLELGERADKANANLSLPTMGMVLGMVLFLGYPILTRIGEAFA